MRLHSMGLGVTLQRERVDGEGWEDQMCPFASYRQFNLNRCCGSWCPLFSFEKSIDPDEHGRWVVILHCGNQRVMGAEMA